MSFSHMKKVKRDGPPKAYRPGFESMVFLGHSDGFPIPEVVSAYDIAVKNGFEGTEQEWLDSLVGPQGDHGPGWTGASYDPITGFITFVSGDDLTFSTGDIRGPQGPQGIQGEVGPQGEQGPVGPAGADSVVPGPVGPQGIQGETGPQGPQGETGLQGTTGPKGDTGDVGPQGPQGIPGEDSTVPGPQGIQGEVGPQGPIGPKGDAGETGPQGLQGQQGIPGSDGLGWTGAAYNPTTGIVTFSSDDGLAFVTGDLRGDQGIQGPQGIPGEIGPQGEVGPEGPQGIQGVQGETGLQGAQGEPGLDGLDGVDGLGWTGASYDPGTGVITFSSDDGLGFLTSDLRGAAGPKGDDGAQGLLGPTGATGPQGEAGPQGIQGDPGPAGADGLGWTGASYDSETGVVTFVSTDGLGFATTDLRGADGPQGPKGDIGDTGPAGPTGATGLQGPQGEVGPTGATGPAGSDGLGWTGAVYNPIDGIVTFSSTDGLGFSTGDLRGAQGEIGSQGPQGEPGPTGPAGADGSDGLGWTGAVYDPGTGVITFQSTDGLGFATGDLRGADGATGPQGPQGEVGVTGVAGPAGSDGLGWTGAIYDAGTGIVTFDSTDGLEFSTGDLRGAEGPVGPQGAQGAKGDTGDVGPQGSPGADGLGWTSGSYDSLTGVVTFASDDGLGFSTNDLRGSDGLNGAQGPQGIQGQKGDTGDTGPQGPAGTNGLGWTSGAYNPSTGVVTFSSDDGLEFFTADLRGATGATGAQGPQGIQGEVGPQGIQGIQGVTGPEGPQGPVGPEGPEGSTTSYGTLAPVAPEDGDTWWDTETGQFYIYYGSVWVEVFSQGPEGPPGADATWVEITQAAYDLLSPPDPNTLYIIIG